MRRILRALGLCWLMLACFAMTARADDIAGIHVCVRPPGAEGANIWAYASNGATVVGMKREDFKKASAGLVVYVFDPAAPPDSVKQLPKQFAGLKCPPPNAPPPKGAQAPAPSASAGGTQAQPAGTGAGGTDAKGDSRGTGKSGGDGTGTGPKKTLSAKIAEEIAYAGAIANLQLNEDKKRADGKPYGIVGGKNPDGPNHPAVQAAAGAVMVAAVVLSANADKFMKKAQALAKVAAEKGEAKLATLAFKDLEELGEKGAEELAKLYGADITKALSQNKAIGPYEVMKKFTDKLGGSWQAHHILEKKFARDFALGNADKIPSVILSDAEHKAITAMLKVNTADVKTAEELWAAYQRAYVDHPDWLAAIKSHFVKSK